MITGIDSSTLHAIFNAESNARRWVEILAKSREEGPLIICDVVYAELAPAFSSQEAFEKELGILGVEFDPIRPEAAFLAGKTFRAYRMAKGPRTRMIPDFLIGAHAQLQADQLATFDDGYLRRYFSSVKLLTIAT